MPNLEILHDRRNDCKRPPAGTFIGCVQNMDVNAPMCHLKVQIQSRSSQSSAFLTSNAVHMVWKPEQQLAACPVEVQTLAAIAQVVLGSGDF